MDAAQWHQEIGLVTSSSAATAGAVAASGAACATAARPPATERRTRPQKEQALNCPRCNSTNTKFCYYNNYSLTQPRYFCKTCRRYWTEGGSLRNVPVGGGSRKNKRSSLSTTIAAATATAAASGIPATSSLTTKKLPSGGGGDLLPPPKFHDGQDLNLGFPQPAGLPEFSESSTTALSAMELLRSTARGIRAPPPFLPLQLSEYPSGFGLQEFRAMPTLNFTMEGLGGGSGGGVSPSAATGYGPLQDVQESSRMLFPFEEAKPLAHDATSTAASEFDRGGGGGAHGRAQQGGDPPGFWSGMLGGSGGGGGSW